MTHESSLEIRRMQESDPPLLAAAFADMNKTKPQYERYWQENVEGKRMTLVAQINGSVVGYANVIWEPDYEPFRKQRIPLIQDMNTVTNLRKKGIGTRMIAAVENLVRTSGRRTVGIGVGVTPDYAIAQRLYPNLGYVSDGTGVHEDQWGGCSYAIKTLCGEVGGLA
jgi:GNAT superfamily N-acetyltransferase